MRAAAIGFRVHSGWAALVAVSGSREAPELLIRRRIEIADAAISGSKQPFHYAKELGLSKAQGHLDRCAESSRALARAALEKAIADLSGFKVSGCAVLLSSGRAAVSLEATLGSHAAIHTAEGMFFREAIASAVEGCKLRCVRIKEKDLLVMAAEAVETMEGLGKSIGPPWRQDEKYAALGAWVGIHCLNRAQR
jgi:hypothetical protein